MIVYGIPILLFALLVGIDPLRRWRAEMGKAVVEGLRWYGLLSLLALAATIVAAAVLLRFDPSAIDQLRRPNPDLQAASGDPWLWIALSFGIGAIEETIFRGWVFGYWLAQGNHGWILPAIGSSLLFVGVHLYYATTYGLAAVIVYPELFLVALSFAAGYRYSGGNLVVIALLHGAYDAASFLTLVSLPAGLALRYGVVGLGLLVAIAVSARSPRPLPPAPVSPL